MFVRLLRSKPRNGRMEVGALHAMTLTCQSVFTADSVRRHAQLMQLLRYLTDLTITLWVILVRKNTALSLLLWVLMLWTTQSCHRQVDNAGWMSPWLAIIWWRLSPSSTSPGIAQTIEEGHAVNWCHKSVEGRLAFSYGGQFHFSGRLHNPTSWFWSSPASVVTAESFSDRSGPL